MIRSIVLFLLKIRSERRCRDRSRSRHEDFRAKIQSIEVRGDGRAHAVLLLLDVHGVDGRGHEHAVAQRMRPECDRGTGPAHVAALPARDRVAARRVVDVGVEAQYRGNRVTGVRRVRRPVERSARQPAPAADVPASARADGLRRGQPVAGHRVLGRVTGHQRSRAVGHRVSDRVDTVLHGRHVRVPGRRHRHGRPDRAHRILDRRHVAGLSLWLAGHRLSERLARFRETVRPERRPERPGLVPGSAVGSRHVTAVHRRVRFILCGDVRPQYRRR